MRKIFSHTFSGPEADLVSECIRNSRVAQKALFEKYKNAMYSTALRIIGNTDEAQDVLQDTFIDVFENISSFRFESTLGAWMKTILVRKALRRLKLDRNHEILEKAEEMEGEDFKDEFTGEYLEKAIQSLPESARAVFLLIEVEGYKHKEVAQMLNITEGTSKSQLHYSKSLLQKKLYQLYKS